MIEWFGTIVWFVAIMGAFALVWRSLKTVETLAVAVRDKGDSERQDIVNAGIRLIEKGMAPQDKQMAALHANERLREKQIEAVTERAEIESKHPRPAVSVEQDEEFSAYV